MLPLKKRRSKNTSQSSERSTFDIFTPIREHPTIPSIPGYLTDLSQSPQRCINRLRSWRTDVDPLAGSSTISRIANRITSPRRTVERGDFLDSPQLSRFNSRRTSRSNWELPSQLPLIDSLRTTNWANSSLLERTQSARSKSTVTSKHIHFTNEVRDNSSSPHYRKEQYPRPHKTRYTAWDIFDLDRLQKLADANKRFVRHMSLTNAIIASSVEDPCTSRQAMCAIHGSPRIGVARTRPQMLRPISERAPLPSPPVKVHSFRSDFDQMSGNRMASSSAGRTDLNRRDTPTSATNRNVSRSPSPRWGCFPRSQSAPPEQVRTSAPPEQVRTLTEAFRQLLVAATAPVIPNAKYVFKNKGGKRPQRGTPFPGPAASGSTPAAGNRQKLPAPPKFGPPAASTGAIRKQPNRTQTPTNTQPNASATIIKDRNKFELEKRIKATRKAKEKREKCLAAAHSAQLARRAAITHISRKDLHQLQQQAIETTMENRTMYPRPDMNLKCNRGSHSSESSSAYSGSDLMTSIHSSSAVDVDEVDLSGLVESIVDSDEDDLIESLESLNVRDAVRECLEKDPSERTEEDIETLLEFTQGLKAFTNITLAVRRALCSVMVFAVVDKAGTIVMSDGEELDSWSVLINGHVEIDHGNGEKEELQMGDSFGILPTMDKLYHRGVMKTKCNDCQFVCITQTDYYRIQHQGEENTKRHEEDGKVVMVTELRQIGPDTNVGSAMKRGHVVIRGTIERLLLQLVEENSMTDPTYVEDFLLTHRTFIRNPQEVATKLLSWFENEEAGTSASPQEIRDRVTRVVLLWVNNHFTDFETDTEMMEFLETFESGLERKNLLSQLRLLHIACAAKARTRTVTLARSSRDENLNFSFVGGYERGGYGIFISKVEKNSKPDDVGLKRGDQILEVNGQSFEHVTNARAMEIIMGSTHLSITVKSNLLAFKEMIQSPDSNSPRPRTNPRRICASDIAKLHGNADARPAMLRLSSADMLGHDQVDCCPSPFRERESSNGSLVGGIATASHFVAGLLGTSSSSKKDSSTLSVTSSNNSTSSSSSTMSTSTGHQKGGFMTLGPKRRLQKALIKMNLLPKNTVNSSSMDASDAALLSAEGGSSHGGCHDDGRSANAAANNASAGGASSNYNTGGNLAGLYHSRSNPDLTSTIYYEDTRQMDYPEHVLKVYKSDQTCKYLLINKETTAHEVVMLALQEFGIHETSSNFSLCEVSVGEGGMIKQRRLPEQLQNLAERIGLASRYYLKTNGITETLVPDDLALDLVRESTVHFLQLNANEVAIQLTFQDFAIFRQIESTEYVDDLFELKSKYGVPMLKQFAELVNREMFWVVTEVCSEHNIVRRMKIVKQFIKIARHCKECRNFNSMFAIVSGLGHAAVTRLRQTWEKLPSKYQKLFADLQDLMDPSRNMSKYRQLVSAEFLAQHPIIPFYPVVKKDLTFIHLGNDTKVENLINFEKLRMIAKEVRILTHMCSSTYDLLTMLEFKGQPPSSAMVALNQMSVSSGPHHIHGNAGQATVKRRKKSTAAPNPKKMFEEAQMVRRVKAYLNNMKVITDEDVLHRLSLECEPSATSSGTGGSGGSTGGGGGGGGSISGGSAPSSVTIRKRHPSPTLSTTSSTSSTSEGRKGGLGPKFGTASPQAVKKILSLSEPTKTRPYQPRHPGIMLPLAGHPHTFHYALHSSISPSPSPGAHRRMGSGTGVSASGPRAVHERSHSDTPTPLPSVDLSVESSSVTSFSNLPLRKTMTSGSVTSSDSGHGSYVQPDVHLSNYSESNSSNTAATSGGGVGGGLYHLNVQLSSNASTSPKLQQRRHSAIHAPGYYYNAMTLPPSPTIVNQMDHHAGIVGRKASPTPTPPPPLPHPKSTLDERLMGLSIHQQYHHGQIPPLPPPSMHSQQMKNCNATASGAAGGGCGGGSGSGSVSGGSSGGGGSGGMCIDGSLGFGPATVRNLQYHPLPPPPPLSQHQQQHQQHQQQHQQQALQQHLQQHNSQYHTARNVGHGVLVNSLVPPTKGPRYPPSYTVAAHMARLQRLGRAQSLERVANSLQSGVQTGQAASGSGGNTSSYYQHELADEDESEAQVSAV